MAGGPRRRAEKEDALERRAANRELGRALQTLRLVRVGYVAFALFFFGIFLLFVKVTVAFGVTGGPVALLLMGPLLGVALFSVGAWRVMYEPFAWGVALASVMTLTIVPTLAVADLDVGTGIFVALCLFSWFSVIPLVRVRKLQQQYPDLWITSRMRGKVRKGRAVATATKARLGVALTVGGIVVGVVLLLVVAQIVTAPPSVTEPIERFAAAWNAGDLESVQRFAASQRFAGRMPRRLERFRERYGWDSRLPRVGEPRVMESRDDYARVVFPIATGTLETRWQLMDGRWVLTMYGIYD